METLSRLGSLPALLVITGFLIAALRLAFSPGSLNITIKPDPVQIDLDLGEIADEIDEIERGVVRAPRRRKRRKSA